MSDSNIDTYGNRFYIELRRLSGFDFTNLGDENIERLKNADRKTTIQLLLGNGTWSPRWEPTPEEWAAVYLEWVRQRLKERIGNPDRYHADMRRRGELGIKIVQTFVDAHDRK